MTFSSSVTLTLDYPVSSSLVASLLLSFKVKEFFFNRPTFFKVMNEYQVARLYLFML